MAGLRDELSKQRFRGDSLARHVGEPGPHKLQHDLHRVWRRADGLRRFESIVVVTAHHNIHNIHNIHSIHNIQHPASLDTHKGGGV